MRKIGIMTLHGYFNYGNRLQNYALQEVLRSMGFHVETIKVVWSPKTEKKSFSKRLSSFCVDHRSRLFIEIFNHFLSKKYDHYRRNRNQLFVQFTNEYIKESNLDIHNDHLPDYFCNKYDYFVSGSDQVWNPYMNHGSPIFFLTFAPKYKRIAYAASFGISSIPDLYLQDYKRWLMEMSSISVRENAGADIVWELTGRKVPVLIDPVLFLNKEKWMSIARPSPSKPRNNFLLSYFLGDKTKELSGIIRDTAKKNNLKVIDFMEIKKPQYFQVGPREFIDYISSATIIFTDSFHGSIFSMLFKKPFVLFKREGYSPSLNSRIDTLLSTFSLQSRFWDNMTSNDSLFNADFDHVSPILEKERTKARTFLDQSLSAPSSSSKVFHNAIY